MNRFTSLSLLRLLCTLTLAVALASAGDAAPAPAPHHSDPLPFITRRGDRLFAGNEEFRFISTNLPDVLQIISNYAFDGDTAQTRLRVPDEFEQRDAMRTVRQLGGRVARTFVITATTSGNSHAMFDVSTSPVVAHEPALVALDRLLVLAREEGVRLIVPLIAYKSPLRGDPSTYGADFWVTGSATNLKFKSMLTQLLNRTNSLSGVPYRDDPTLFAWQTGNELVIGDDPQRQAWLHDIAAFIKQLAPHHLLIDGRNKPNDVYDRYAEFIDDPNLDAVSYHTYVNLPQANTPAGTLRLIRDQLRGKKPLLVTEVAMYTKPDALRALLDEVIADGTVGANWWAIRFHNRDGGFYKHSDQASQFEDLNWPGFDDGRSALPEVVRERELLGILHEYAGKILGQPPTPATIPAPPTLLPTSDPAHLTWQGSTGASGYQVQRASAPGGPWTTLESNLGDHLAPYTPLFADATAEVGRQYFYRVIAHNAAGASAPSSALGPVALDRRWLIDDLFDLQQTAPATRNVAIKQAYAHDAFLEDIAVAQRADATQPATLVYHVSGAIAEFTVTVFANDVAPEFYLAGHDSPRQKIQPTVALFDQGKRARYRFTGTATAGTLEIVLLPNAAPGQALGRVEIAYRPVP